VDPWRGRPDDSDALSGATRERRVAVEAEFTVSGETAGELVGAAVARLEQLKGGPLLDGEAPRLRHARPFFLSGAGVPHRWEADVSAVLSVWVEVVGGVGHETTGPGMTVER